MRKTIGLWQDSPAQRSLARPTNGDSPSAWRVAPVLLLVLALVAGPVYSPAQKKDDLLEIQRDIAELSERVKNLQKGQDDKMMALQSLVQQAAAASSQVTQEMATLQKNLATTLNNSLADQNGKVSQTVGTLSTQMDALRASLDQLNQALGQMNGRLDKIDGRLKDVNDKVSTINTPPPAPPSAAGLPATAPDVSANSACPGVTRIGLHDDAERDYSSSYDDMAIKEFAQYIKCFRDDEYAPSAGYYIGMIYARQKDYDDAVDAFQKVIEAWPQNNKAQDAMYQKAMALKNGGHKSDAITTLREFISKYPANDYNSVAKTELNKLTAAPAGAGRGKQRPSASH